MQPINRALLVYFPINTGAGSTTPFPDVPELNGADVLITGFEVFTDAQLSATPDQVATLAAADAPDVVVTLNDGSNERFKQMPYTTLVAALNAGMWKDCQPFRLDFQKSVLFNTAAVGASNAAILFYYVREGDPNR